MSGILTVLSHIWESRWLGKRSFMLPDSVRYTAASLPNIWVATSAGNFIYNVRSVAERYLPKQTCCRIPDRVREHKAALTKPSRFSYVTEHSKDSRHNIDWFNVKIITRDNITIKRLIKETLTISSLKPEMNAMQSSVQLNVFS